MHGALRRRDGGGNNSPGRGVREDIQALDEGRRAGSECPREAHCVREEALGSAHASRRTKQPPIPQHRSEISKKGAQHPAQGMASCVGKQSGAVGATSRPAAPPQHRRLPQGARPWCGDSSGAPLWVLPPLFWLCQSPLLCSGGLCTDAELPPLMLRMPLCLVTSSSSCFPFRERSVPTSHPTLKRGGSGD